MTCVLGIESTCDETACSIVQDGQIILSNVIASQAKLHEKYGGVFPEIAARLHVDLIIPVIEEALEEAKVLPDLVAVAKGPGLIGPLLVGLNAAKTLSLAWEIPFVGINHVEAHLYAAMMSNNRFIFPAIGLVVSGGHTLLVRILNIGNYELIGMTVDDAVGETFDKVASMLGLPYPGGFAIETLAKKGDPKTYSFKPGIVKDNPWNFSFSGIKTNVLYTIKGQNGRKHSQNKLSEKDFPHIAASFQEAALKNIVSKTLDATKTFDCQAIYVGGGVSQNNRLREMFVTEGGDTPIYWPARELCLDNAAMIAGLGFHKFKGKGDPLDLEPETRMRLA